MTTTTDRSEFDAALKTLEAKEDAAMAQLEAVAEERRTLPMLEITKDYRFGSPDGEKSLADLFNGQKYLVLYHFMFAPEWEKGCPDCTQYAKGHGDVSLLNNQETEFALVSRAPSEKLEAWKKKQGITMPWYSCSDEFARDMIALDDGGDRPAMTAWKRDSDGKVWLTYQTNGMIVGSTIPQHMVVNLTARGADELG